MAYLTGSPLWDLILVGAAGGLLLGGIIFSGVLKALYWSFIGRMYPVIGRIKRPSKKGDPLKAPLRDYGVRKKDRATGQLYLQFFKTKARTPPLNYADIITDEEGKQWFDGVQVSPDKIVPLSSEIGEYEVAMGEDGKPKLDEHGNPVTILRAREATQPIWRAEADFAYQERINDGIANIRYKKKADFWTNPALVNALTAGIILICLGVFCIMALPKIAETVNGMFSGSVDSVGDKCLKAGVNYGVQAFIAYQTKQLDLPTINQTAISQNKPPDAQSSTKPNVFGIPI